MTKTLEAVEWETLGQLAWIGLTYPAEFPRDGKIVKRHLKAFKQRWERAFGKPIGAWKQEYQRRGAAHLHLLLVLPASVRDQIISWETFRAWVAANWHEACGKLSQEHLVAGTSCELWRAETSPGGYFAGYGSKGTKEYQNAPHPDYLNPGRVWGLWGIRPNWAEVEITGQQFVAVKRVISRLRRSWERSRGQKPSAEGRYKVRHRGVLAGGWVAGGPRSGALATQISRGVL